MGGKVEDDNNPEKKDDDDDVDKHRWMVLSVMGR